MMMVVVVVCCQVRVIVDQELQIQESLKQFPSRDEVEQLVRAAVATALEGKADVDAVNAALAEVSEELARKTPLRP